MQERALENIGEATSFNPQEAPMDLKSMQQRLRALPLNLECPIAKALVSGEPIESVVAMAGWTLRKARLVKADTLTGPEVAFEIDLESRAKISSKDGIGTLLRMPFWNPSTMSREDDKNQYWHCRFEDGVYARVPRIMDPEMDEICFEFGSLLTRGRGLHRLVATGDRSKGLLHTLVYERWGPPTSAEAKKEEDALR